LLTGNEMLKSIESFFVLTFTGKDNHTPDIGRILWAIGVLIFFGLAVYDTVILHNAFKASEYGLGLGGTLAGGGAALGFKAKTEPES